MAFKMEVESGADVVVVRCAGRLVRGEPICELKRAVTSNPEARIVLLDLSDVEIMDGGGLGTLVMLRRWTWENGIQLKLVSPSHLVRELLDRTHLAPLFDISNVGDVLAILGCQHQPAQYRYAAAS
jgi:anti-anti-sigma factor